MIMSNKVRFGLWLASVFLWGCLAAQNSGFGAQACDPRFRIQAYLGLSQDSFLKRVDGTTFASFVEGLKNTSVVCNSSEDKIKLVDSVFSYSLSYHDKKAFLGLLNSTQLDATSKKVKLDIVLEDDWNLQLDGVHAPVRFLDPHRPGHVLQELLNDDNNVHMFISKSDTRLSRNEIIKELAHAMGKDSYVGFVNKVLPQCGAEHFYQANAYLRELETEDLCRLSFESVRVLISKFQAEIFYEDSSRVFLFQKPICIALENTLINYINFLAHDYNVEEVIKPFIKRLTLERAQTVMAFLIKHYERILKLSFDLFLYGFSQEPWDYLSKFDLQTKKEIFLRRGLEFEILDWSFSFRASFEEMIKDFSLEDAQALALTSRRMKSEASLLKEIARLDTQQYFTQKKLLYAELLRGVRATDEQCIFKFLASDLSQSLSEHELSIVQKAFENTQPFMEAALKEKLLTASLRNLHEMARCRLSPRLSFEQKATLVRAWPQNYIASHALFVDALESCFVYQPEFHTYTDKGFEKYFKDSPMIDFVNAYASTAMVTDFPDSVVYYVVWNFESLFDPNRVDMYYAALKARKFSHLDIGMQEVLFSKFEERAAGLYNEMTSDQFKTAVGTLVAGRNDTALAHFADGLANHSPKLTLATAANSHELNARPLHSVTFDYEVLGPRRESLQNESWVKTLRAHIAPLKDVKACIWGQKYPDKALQCFLSAGSYNAQLYEGLQLGDLALVADLYAHETMKSNAQNNKQRAVEITASLDELFADLSQHKVSFGDSSITTDSLDEYLAHGYAKGVPQEIQAARDEFMTNIKTKFRPLLFDVRVPRFPQTSDPQLHTFILALTSNDYQRIFDGMQDKDEEALRFTDVFNTTILSNSTLFTDSTNKVLALDTKYWQSHFDYIKYPTSLFPSLDTASLLALFLEYGIEIPLSHDQNYELSQTVLDRVLSLVNENHRPRIEALYDKLFYGPRLSKSANRLRNFFEELLNPHTTKKDVLFRSIDGVLKSTTAEQATKHLFCSSLTPKQYWYFPLQARYKVLLLEGLYVKLRNNNYHCIKGEHNIYELLDHMPPSVYLDDANARGFVTKVGSAEQLAGLLNELPRLEHSHYAAFRFLQACSRYISHEQFTKLSFEARKHVFLHGTSEDVYLNVDIGEFSKIGLSLGNNEQLTSFIAIVDSYDRFKHLYGYAPPKLSSRMVTAVSNNNKTMSAV